MKHHHSSSQRRAGEAVYFSHPCNGIAEATAALPCLWWSSQVNLPVWGGIVLIARPEGSLKQTPPSPDSFQLKTSDNQSSPKSIYGTDMMWLRNLSMHSKAAAQGTSAVA